jgi:glycosyltransferase involved in cell wall biosynthesis
MKIGERGRSAKAQGTRATQAMPRVLYFSSATHVQGGAVQLMFRTARGLKRLGGVPIVVLPRGEGIAGWYAKEGISVHIIPFIEMRRRWSPTYLARYLLSTIRLIARLVALIKDQRVDIVHVNEITYFPGLMAGKIGGARTICHVRVILTRPGCVRRAVSWIARRFSDQILCESEAVRTWMFPGEGGNVRTLYPPGPDMERFDPLAVQSKDEIRSELRIDSAVFLVGQVSKFTPNKNQMALVRAGEYIKERYGDVQIAYLLVGGKVAGHEDYLHQVVRRIGESDLSNQFCLAGLRSDIPRMIAACDAIVHLPTHEDPLPGVVLEAMAMEKPVVAFDSGGIREQFENGRSGILLEKNDIEKLAETLVALEGDEALRLKMGKEARRFLVRRFSLEKFFSELAPIYAELVSPTGPSGV